MFSQIFSLPHCSQVYRFMLLVKCLLNECFAHQMLPPALAKFLLLNTLTLLNFCPSKSSIFQLPSPAHELGVKAADAIKASGVLLHSCQILES
uniref:Uncharacterized protein n=1 Tax=Physcomitrium patens TaxID=3218 RepID=A0A2K1JY83_PHYPA|nr:hypothetical protein PHYPA_013603 [Physcomitrium patens]